MLTILSFCKEVNRIRNVHEDEQKVRAINIKEVPSLYSSDQRCRRIPYPPLSKYSIYWV